MTKSIPPIRLYGIVSFDRGAKAKWLLTEMGISYESKWLDREKKENESPAFLRLNPMGRIPVLEIGDEVIFESGAICAYLADRFLEKGLAPALDSPLRAKYQQWLYFAASTVDVFQTRMMIIEDIPAGEVRTTKESALLEEFADAMETLEVTLSKSPYLLGSRISTADICVGYQLYWCQLWPEFETILLKKPSVKSYLDHLRTLPAAIESKAFSYEE